MSGVGVPVVLKESLEAQDKTHGFSTRSGPASDQAANWSVGWPCPAKYPTQNSTQWVWISS